MISPLDQSVSMMSRRRTLMWSSPNEVPQVAGQVLPGSRRVADAEPLRVGHLEAPLGQELPGVLCVRAGQPLGVVLGGGAVRVDQPPPLALLLAGNVAALLVAQLEAGPA